MMKNLLSYCKATAAVAVGLASVMSAVSCDNTENTGSGVGSDLSVDENKAQLDKTASALVNKINVDGMSKLGNDLSDAVMSLEDFEGNTIVPEVIFDYVNEFADKLESGNIYSFADYVDPSNKLWFEIEKCYGTYTVNQYNEWDCAKNDDAMVFVVEDFELIAAVSDKKYPISNGMANNEIPAAVRVILNQNGVEKANLYVAIQEYAADISFDSDMVVGTAYADAKVAVNFKYGNYELVASAAAGVNVKGDEDSYSYASKATAAEFALKIDGETVVQGSSNLANLDIDSELVTEEDDYYEYTWYDETINSGGVSLGVSLMNSVFVKASIADFAAMSREMEAIDDKYDWIDRQETDKNGTTIYYSGWSEDYCREEIAIMNKHLDVYFNYDNTDARIGSLAFDYDYYTEDEESDDWNNDGFADYIYRYYYYDVVPVIEFAIDGSRYAIDESAKDDFSSTITALENLLERVEDLADSLGFDYKEEVVTPDVVPSNQ